MAILQVDNLSKSFGILQLFENLTFSIEKGEKIGLIAPNGAGKTTLLRILVGEEPADGGEITTQHDLKIAYLSQSSDFSSYPDILSASISGIDPELQEVILGYEQAVESGETQQINTAIAQMDRVDGWHIEQELQRLLSQLDLGEARRSTQGLSGGQSKRIALASVLLRQPDLFILDEPTNHLDPATVEWLEQHLVSSNAALLVVTHDRYFLDQVCNTILELDGHQLYSYQGNYSLYLQKRAGRLEQLESEQATLRNRYRTELEWMRRMPKARGTKAKYRKDAFAKVKGQLTNIQTHQGPQPEARSVYIGKKIFVADKVSKSFENDGTSHEVIKEFSYHFARRDRVGIIGPNGAGKTTLIRLITQELPPTSGIIEVGETVRFGYFSQMPPTFPKSKKVIEVVTDIAERVVGRNGAEHSAMQLLNRFLFPPKRQQDYVTLLSGGERRRLQLCTVLMQQPNFLVLDEPTNDLDIPTLQVLEQYLVQFDGCLIVVSHDRYFMDRVTEHLFVLQGDGLVCDFPGNYSDFRNHQKEKAKQVAATPTAPKEEVSSKRPLREKKAKLTYSQQRELEELTRQIPRIEEQLKVIEAEMSSGEASPQRLQELAEQYSQKKERLDDAELRWLELSEVELAQ